MDHVIKSQPGCHLPSVRSTAFTTLDNASLNSANVIEAPRELSSQGSPDVVGNAAEVVTLAATGIWTTFWRRSLSLKRFMLLVQLDTQVLRVVNDSTRFSPC